MNPNLQPWDLTPAQRSQSRIEKYAPLFDKLEAKQRKVRKHLLINPINWIYWVLDIAHLYRKLSRGGIENPFSCAWRSAWWSRFKPDTFFNKDFK